MKQPTSISELKNHVGREVTLSGWIHHSRPGGKICFIVLRDGTGFCQLVVEKNEQTASFYDDIKRLSQESSLEVTGTVHADERATGGFEVRVTHANVIHAARDYPITPKSHGIDFLMRHRHLWFRSQRPWNVLRIRATVVDQIRRFFNDNGYVLIDTPIFAPAAGEGAQTLFKVDYFGDPVYLAQTGQLYLEAACMAHRKVYCFGPTFRAEKSKTRRHLTEFWMVEPEIAFASLDDVIAVAEDFVCSLVERVLRDHSDELTALGRDLSELEAIKKPFYRLRYDQCVELLHSSKARELLENDLVAKQARISELGAKIDELDTLVKSDAAQWKKDKAAGEVIELREDRVELQEQMGNIPHHIELAKNFEWGGDLGGSDETIISRLHDRPVFCTHYPKGVKAFYMRECRDDARVVENFDLLAPQGVGEIIGGSAREEDYDRLLARIEHEHLPQADYEWYLDLRRFGSVPHGGFGLGVERTVAWICGVKHIRETIPYPRMMGKFYP
ncbi:MAG: asparagine--tRNA ligase [Planctomycetes bacterium]|nr:asparagine--tRNA ligase [Planctomycetota bacterium]MBI3833881.1 asparagine--tRNA ligase [Planctomycetota bacterium]